MRELILDNPCFRYPTWDAAQSGRCGFCRLRVFVEDGKPPLVIVSELADNPGPSITNAAEQVVQAVYEHLGRPSGGLIYFEHYGPFSYDDGDREEEYSLVTFRQVGVLFFDPLWTFQSRETLAAHIGQRCKCGAPATNRPIVEEFPGMGLCDDCQREADQRLGLAILEQAPC